MLSAADCRAEPICYRHWRGAPLKPDRLRRWVRPGQPHAYDQAPTGADAGVYDDRPALVHDRDVPDDHGLVEDLPGHKSHPLP
jgi:hypothetical protein